MHQKLAVDTIVAPATPSGPGGVGVIRISGPNSLSLLHRIFVPNYTAVNNMRPWLMHRGNIIDSNGQHIDDALAVFMPGPKSFTGEDVVELHSHGSPALINLIISLLLDYGANLAKPGEFSRRAVLNGRMDLSQAEAVAELIAAPGQDALHLAFLRLNGSFSSYIRELRKKTDELKAQICLAIDFPDDEIDAGLTAEIFEKSCAEILLNIDALISAYERKRPQQEGINLALTGPVNAGKSSLLNALIGRERALVSDMPGTTRDYIEESLMLNGLPVCLIDTAGLRKVKENDAQGLEAKGIKLGLKAAKKADIVLLLIDGKEPDKKLTARALLNMGKERTILVWNKLDVAKPQSWLKEEPFTGAVDTVELSAKEGLNLDKLEKAVCHAVLGDRGSAGEKITDTCDNLPVPNLRQCTALRRARLELEKLLQDVENQVPWDLCSVRLEGVASILGEVIGESAPQEVLNSIFAKFCIGK